VLIAARHRKVARVARNAGRGLLVAVMAAIVVLGVLRAGTRYFYCDATGIVFATPCCGGSHHEGADRGQVEARTDDCCKGRSLGSLPPAAVQIRPATPPAPFIGMLANVAVARLESLVERRAVRANLTGPPLLSPSAHRARLMVFLI
jgi:hypothetical protein